MLVRADGRLGREGRLLRTLVGLAVLVGTLALAPRAFASGTGEAAGPGEGLHAAQPTRPYVVADGDTLWAIAAAVEPGTPQDEAVAAIMRLNSMSTASIRPGEQILVPVDSQAAPAES